MLRLSKYCVHCPTLQNFRQNKKMAYYLLNRLYVRFYVTFYSTHFYKQEKTGRFHPKFNSKLANLIKLYFDNKIFFVLRSYFYHFLAFFELFLTSVRQNFVVLHYKIIKGHNF